MRGESDVMNIIFKHNILARKESLKDLFVSLVTITNCRKLKLNLFVTSSIHVRMSNVNSFYNLGFFCEF